MKKRLAIFLGCVLGMTAMVMPALAKSVETKEKIEESETTNSDLSKKDREYIYFGHYEQDNNTANGPEEIKWIVLAKKGDKILVQSEDLLDVKPYHEAYIGVNWEDCTLREWMNDEFYNTAFTDEERQQIEQTYLQNEIGPDTEDYVFVLSADEADQYYADDDDRIAKPTPYAIEQGAYVNEDKSGGCWWLRSYGFLNRDVSDVKSNGIIFKDGIDVTADDCAVRPVMWISVK